MQQAILCKPMYWPWPNGQRSKNFVLPFLSCLVLALPTQAVPEVYTTTSSQARKQYNEAAKHYIRKEYAEAIQRLEQALKKDRKFVEAYLQLATIYQQLDDFGRAMQLLDQAYGYLAKERYAPLHYAIAHRYYRSGLYGQAQTVLQALPLTETIPAALLAKINTLHENLQFALEKIQHPIALHPRRLSAPLNQFVSQYFPVLTVDQQSLLFTARTGYAEQCRENLYISHQDTAGNWSAPRSIADQINAPTSNEGTCTISADKKTLVLTSCSRAGNYGTCDLYVSYQKGGIWSAPQNLGPNINTARWQSQPALSADGRVLYFVAERAGNYGKKDIWQSTRQENGQWAQPVNLGPRINTPGQEIAPFIHPNGQTLFFASDRSPSMGGFDIYYASLVDGQWTEPVNLGYPINNHKDQVSLFITADGKKAYYADGRQKGSHYYSSHLYEFDMPTNLVPMPKSDLVRIKVLDAKTRQPLAAQVAVYDMASDVCQARIQVDETDGETLIVVNEGQEYMVYIHKDGHLFESIHVDYKHQDSTVSTPAGEVLLRPLEVGQVKLLRHVYFGFDAYTLEERSKTELNRLVAFLQAHPHLAIVLEGHTDHVGAEGYNDNLSLQRAKAVYDYLMMANIAPERLSYRGYGKSRPLVPNDMAANRRLNRRVAFRITRIGAKSSS